MELDRFEAEMLDAVLEAFGNSDRLTRAQVLDLFALDEEMAAAVIDILNNDGYVKGMSPSEDHPLPDTVFRLPAGLAFLKAGGYSAKLIPEAEPQQTPVAPKQESWSKAPRETHLELQMALREAERKTEQLNKKLRWLRVWQYLVFVLLIIAIGLAYWVYHLHHLHKK